MSDIEFYEKWCEYNENNLPLSFAEFCYQQGKAEGVREFVDRLRVNFDLYAWKNSDEVIDCTLAEMQKGAEYERV